MPKYRALRTHFINDKLVDPGQVVDYDGEPGRFLVAVDGDSEAKKRKAESDKHRDARIKALQKGETPELPRVVEDVEPQRGPTLIKSHPILPNLEGSSGEITGESPIASPEAKARLAEEMAGVAVRRSAARRSRPSRVKRAAKKRGTYADQRPTKPQSTPVASPDEQ